MSDLIKQLVEGAIADRKRHDARELEPRESFEAFDGTPYFKGPRGEIRRLDYKPTLKERKAMNAERRRANQTRHR